MVRRIADILEKFAVGSLLVGFYQGNYIAVTIAVLSGAGCLYLTHRGQR